MSRIITVTSGKGGVGKTTVVANLGVELSRLGERVLLVDMNFCLNSLDVVLGMEGKANFTLSDVINARARAQQALLRHGVFKNLYLLSVATEEEISPQQIRAVLLSLSSQFDYILIDGPSGAEFGFHCAVAQAEEYIVVTAPHITCIKAADKIVDILRNYEPKSISLFVNFSNGLSGKQGKVISPKEISELLQLPLLAKLPMDKEIFLNRFDRLDRSQPIFKVLAKNLKKQAKENE